MVESIQTCDDKSVHCYKCVYWEKLHAYLCHALIVFRNDSYLKLKASKNNWEMVILVQTA